MGSRPRIAPIHRAGWPRDVKEAGPSFVSLVWKAARLYRYVLLCVDLKSLHRNFIAAAGEFMCAEFDSEFVAGTYLDACSRFRGLVWFSVVGSGSVMTINILGQVRVSTLLSMYVCCEPAVDC